MVCTARSNMAALHHNYLITIPDGTEPVGYDQNCAVTACYVLINLEFEQRVQRSRCLIQDQDRGINRQRSRDFQTLSLTATEIGPALSHMGKQTTPRGNHLAWNQLLGVRFDPRGLAMTDKSTPC